MSEHRGTKTAFTEKADRRRFRSRLLVRFVKLWDVILVTAPFAVVWYLSYNQRVDNPFWRRGNYLVIFLYFVIYYLVAQLYKGFLIHLSRISEIVYAQMLGVLFDDFVLYIVTWLLAKRLPPVWPMLLCVIAQFGLVIGWATLAHKWYFRSFALQKTIVIYEHEEHLEMLLAQYGMKEHFDVIATPTVEECVANGLESYPEAEVVFLADVHSHQRNRIIKYCIDKGLHIYLIPGVGDAIMNSAMAMNLFHLPILHVERYNPTPEYLFLKRAMDIVLSLAALIILSPLMLIVAVMIKAGDGGSVLYKQERLTKNGKHFNVLKFRSMRMDAEKDGVARLSTGEEDDRITKVGRVIRKLRIDELPQLFNILKGDMSIVGPRPERPEIAQQYEKEIPEFSLRLQAKAGLTGNAQVYGKYNSTPYTKLLMDLYYIAHPSIAQDLRLIMATVKILFLKESTEGVAKGQTTAEK